MTTPINPIPQMAQMINPQMAQMINPYYAQMTNPYYQPPIPPSSTSTSTSILNVVEIFKGVVMLVVVGVVLYALYWMIQKMGDIFGGAFNIVRDILKQPINIAQDILKQPINAIGQIAGTDVGRGVQSAGRGVLDVLNKQPARQLKPLTQALNANTYSSGKEFGKFAGNLADALTFGAGKKIVGAIGGLF